MQGNPSNCFDRLRPGWCRPYSQNKTEHRRAIAFRVVDCGHGDMVGSRMVKVLSAKQTLRNFGWMMQYFGAFRGAVAIATVANRPAKGLSAVIRVNTLQNIPETFWKRQMEYENYYKNMKFPSCHVSQGHTSKTFCPSN